MTASSTRYADPVDDTRRTHSAALVALRSAIRRSADLWRRVPGSHAAVPGLTWTAAETAAHVVGDLREYTETLAGRGDVESFAAGTGSPSRRSTVVNAQHLTAVPERDLRRLAEMLEAQAEQYLKTAGCADETADIVTANGLVLTPPIMTSLLLGEQLLHGLDIARAAREAVADQPP